MQRLLNIFIRSARLEREYMQRHRWEQSVLLWMPLLAVLLVWWLFAEGTMQHLKIGVLDNDGSALSRNAVRYLEAAPSLAVSQFYADEREAAAAMRRGEVYGVVVIPRNFAADIKQGRAAPLVLQLNGQFGSFAGIITRDVQAATATLSAGVEMKALNKRGASPTQAEHMFSPIRTATSALFNISTNYQQFLAAALIPGLLHILAMTAGAVGFGREIRDGSIAAWLRKAGCREHNGKPLFWDSVAALNGKLCWPMLAFTCWGALTLLLLAQVHSVAALNWLACYLAMWLMMLVSLWMGVIAAAWPMSMRMGLSITGFITAPAFAFSGVAFPQIAMPNGARLWSEILPLTSYLKLQSGLLGMGMPWPWSARPLLLFGLSVLLLLLLAAKLAQRARQMPEKWGGR